MNQSRALVFVLTAVVVLTTGCSSQSRLNHDRANPGQQRRDKMISHVVLRSGVRTMDNDNWEGLQDQFVFGLGYDTRSEGWPIAIAGAIDYAKASADTDAGIKVEATTYEVSLGVQRTDLFGEYVETHVGAGGLYNSTAMELGNGFRDRDWAPGAYAQGGASLVLADWVLVGATVRWSTTDDLEFKTADESTDGGALSFMVRLGGRF